MIEMFLCFSCLLELGEGALAQWVVALITLTFFEHEYVGMSVLVFVFTFSFNNYMSLVYGKNRLAAMSTYHRVCKFAILIHFLAMTVLYKNKTCIFSILI